MASQRSGVRSPSAPLFDRLRAGPLGQRDFRFLFLGRTTSFLGNAFANVALAFAVLELTGSKADLGFVLAALGAINGLSSAFFFPAATGIVPQTVPQQLLQPANAILRLGQNSSWIAGAAAGGLVVAATSPGVGIAVDAASFFAAALFLALIHLPSTLKMEASNFFAELREGWREFSTRTWLWVIVLQFGFVNAVELGVQGVLGPAIAKDHLGGA